MGKEIVIEIKKPEIFVLLTFLFIVLFLELQVTLNSPIVFGDEGWHTRISQYMAENLDYPKWGNVIEGTKLFKPDYSRLPFMNLLEAGFYLVFGFHDVIIKFLIPFVGTILLGVVVFLIGLEIKNKETGMIAAIILMSIHALLTYSVLFYPDIFVSFYLAFFLLSFVKAKKYNKKIYWVLTGILAALAFLPDASGYVIFPSLVFMFFYLLYEKKEFLTILKNYIILIVIFILIISGHFLRNTLLFGSPFCSLGVLRDFMGKSCGEELKYKSKYNYVISNTGVESSILKVGLVNYLLFVFGNIWFIPFASICGLFAIILEKKSDVVYVFIILLTFLFILYGSFYGRIEDLSRNMIGTVPFIAIIAGFYLEVLYSFLKTFSKYFIILFILLIMSVSLWSIYPKLQSLKQVKGFSPYFFDACNFIKQNTTKNALLTTIWDHGTIYNCQRRATSLSHMSDSPDIVVSGNLTLVLERLKANEITHIFIQKFSISKTMSLELYPLDFVKFIESHPEHFIKIYENGPSISDCEKQNGFNQNGDLICDGSLVYQIKYD